MGAFDFINVMLTALSLRKNMTIRNILKLKRYFRCLLATVPSSSRLSTLLRLPDNLENASYVMRYLAADRFKSKEFKPELPSIRYRS